jgi:RimJ/RimL family protein N-acetyltransferase
VVPDASEKGQSIDDRTPAVTSPTTVLGVTVPDAMGRVTLRDLTLDAAEDILAGRRGTDWAAGYPTPGDRDIARWLTGHPPGRETDPLYLPRQIIDLHSGLAIGGIGCHQPPDEQLTVEIGYGIAPEVRNQGITTEAVRLLVAELRVGGIRLVTARTHADNPPSQAVLRHNRFSTTGVDPEGLLVWRLPLTPPAPLRR